MANTYDKGDVVRLTGTFTDASTPPVLADPTTVVLRLRNPAGVTSTPATVKDSVGVYHYDLSLDTVGEWAYRWEGTGAVQTAEEATLYVRATRF